MGRLDNRDLDLGVLVRLGELVGRLTAIDSGIAKFADDLDRTTKASHVRMLRILDRIDGFIGDRGLEALVADPAVRIPVLADGGSPALDLEKDGVRSVVWATGYVRRYPWLKAPVLDHRGEIVHRGGVTPQAGLYVIGLTFLRRRRSSFIDGCGLDAEDWRRLSAPCPRPIDEKGCMRRDLRGRERSPHRPPAIADERCR